MKKYFLSLITFSILFTASISAQKWDKDILEDGYEYRYVNHPDDYSGKVRSTIIRKKSDCADGQAVLYVHGHND